MILRRLFSCFLTVSILSQIGCQKQMKNNIEWIAICNKQHIDSESHSKGVWMGPKRKNESNAMKDAEQHLVAYPNHNEVVVVSVPTEFDINEILRKFSESTSSKDAKADIQVVNQLNVKRSSLIGRWHCVETNLDIVLYQNGNADIQTASYKATWELVNGNNIRLIKNHPPVPNFEPLKDGAVEEVIYTITEFSEDRMLLSEFDFEGHWTYIRKNRGN